MIPILHWLPNYNWKSDLLNDIIAGCTILALQIPQGLAYGKLAGAEAINGLYVSLFPVIIYAIFGTSKHISIGTFAVISIASNDALKNFKLQLISHYQNDTTILDHYIINDELTPEATIEVLTSLGLFTGLIQVFINFVNYFSKL